MGITLSRVTTSHNLTPDHLHGLLAS